jgi:hypothetical protein
MSSNPNSANLQAPPKTVRRACRKCRRSEPRPAELLDPGYGKFFQCWQTCACGHRQRINFRRGEL